MAKVQVFARSSRTRRTLSPPNAVRAGHNDIVPQTRVAGRQSGIPTLPRRPRDDESCPSSDITPVIYILSLVWYIIIFGPTNLGRARVTYSIIIDGYTLTTATCFLITFYLRYFLPIKLYTNNILLYSYVNAKSLFFPLFNFFKKY